MCLTAATAAGAQSVAYDAAGNLTLDQRGYTYYYDYENHLTQIKEGATVVAAYTYDALSRRVEKAAGGVTTRYYYDSGWRVLTEVEDDGVNLLQRDWTWGNYLDEALVMTVDDGTTRADSYFGHDHLYSIVAVYSQEGANLDWYEYDAYGRRYSYGDGSPGADVPIAFTGQRLDTLDGGDLEVMYYKARYYDPETGRFLNRDPIGYLTGMSLYEYVRSRPILSRDRYGLWDDRIHFDETLNLAKLAGADDECAKQIASGARQPDIDWPAPDLAGLLLATYTSDWMDDAVLPIKIFHVTDEDKDFADEMWANAIIWHFPADPDGVVRPNSTTARQIMNNGLQDCDLTEFSQGLHVLQDSWAHQGKPPIGGIGHSRAVIKIFGKYILIKGIPAVYSHSADEPGDWPEDARATGLATYNAIRDFMDKCKCECKSSGITPAKVGEITDYLDKKYPGSNKVKWTLPPQK